MKQDRCIHFCRKVRKKTPKTFSQNIKCKELLFMAVFSPSQAHRVPSSFLVLVFARRKIFWQPPRMPVTSTCGNTLGPTTASFVLERTIGKSCLECISDLPSVLLRGVEATNSWPSIVLDRLETFRFLGVCQLWLQAHTSSSLIVVVAAAAVVVVVVHLDFCYGP